MEFLVGVLIVNGLICWIAIAAMIARMSYLTKRGDHHSDWLKDTNDVIMRMLHREEERLRG